MVEANSLQNGAFNLLRLQQLKMVEVDRLDRVGDRLHLRTDRIPYNVMFSASRVLSFTAARSGCSAACWAAVHRAHGHAGDDPACCWRWPAARVLGIVTEIVAVRPVLKKPRTAPLCVVDDGAGADDPAVTAIEWGPTRGRFRGCSTSAVADWISSSGLPMLACAAVIVGLELLYRHTLIGRAFLAIAEDT